MDCKHFLINRKNTADGSERQDGKRENPFFGSTNENDGGKARGNVWPRPFTGLAAMVKSRIEAKPILLGDASKAVGG